MDEEQGKTVNPYLSGDDSTSPWNAWDHGYQDCENDFKAAQIEHARQFPTERDEAAAIIHAYTNGFPVPYEPWHHIDNAHNDLLREIVKQLVTKVNSWPEVKGAWFVYGLPIMEGPIALFLDELEARRFMEKLGYYRSVKFWEFGTLWDEEKEK